MKRNVSLIALYDRDGTILLQHRDAHAKWRPNKWAFFGGKIEDGETATQGVIRETFEEIRYKLQSPQKVFEITTQLSDDYTLTEHYFIEEYDRQQELALCEGQAMKWFSFEEILKVDLVSFQKEGLQKIIAILKGKLNN